MPFALPLQYIVQVPQGSKLVQYQGYDRWNNVSHTHIHKYKTYAQLTKGFVKRNFSDKTKEVFLKVGILQARDIIIFNGKLSRLNRLFPCTRF